MESDKNFLFDFVLRQTWHKIARMYNQKAAQIDITISIGFILMIMTRKGRRVLNSDQEWEWNRQVCPEPWKQWKKQDSFDVNSMP